MKNRELFIVLICVGLKNCFSRRRKSETIRSFHTTGVAIAVDNLIQDYEEEHRKFHEKETSNGGILNWPSLEYKSLSNYCRRYLQHSVPVRSADNTIGNKVITTLNYKKENMSISVAVVMVHCKYRNSHRTFSYYITRAPLPKCVYALNCAKENTVLICNIINKYCKFEDGPLRVHGTQKKKRTEIIRMKHKTTGEPIAKDEYLLQYELEHQKMLNKFGKEGNIIDWPHATLHQRLDSYCFQYMSECAPYRNRENITGSWKVQKLNYQKIANEDIYVTIVTCVLHKNMKRCYHMTRAPEPNCVYALHRMDGNSHQPFAIVFKHCDFEDLTEEQIVSHHEIFVQNIFPKSEVKEEMSNKLETQQLFSEV